MRAALKDQRLVARQTGPRCDLPAVQYIDFSPSADRSIGGPQNGSNRSCVRSPVLRRRKADLMS